MLKRGVGAGISVLRRRHVRRRAGHPFSKASLHVVSLIISYQAFKFIFKELKVIKEANKSIGLLLQKKKLLHFFLYLKLPIDAYQVYIIFKGTDN